MTDQELFDTVRSHLMSMAEPSMTHVDEGSFCAYRGAEGRKCAIGCLIPDELYVPEMEGTSVPEYINLPNSTHPEFRAMKLLLEALTEIGIRPEQLPLLRDLQGVHDTHFSDRERRLQRVAWSHDLLWE